MLRDGSPEAGAFAHGYTYSGHPVGAAVALASLDVLIGQDMVGNAARTGAYLQARLQATVGALPLVGHVRGVGLAAGVEVVADRATRRSFGAELKVAQRIAARCLEDGLIVRALPVGHVLAISPPLCITRAEVDQVVDGSGPGHPVRVGRAAPGRALAGFHRARRSPGPEGDPAAESVYTAPTSAAAAAACATVPSSMAPVPGTTGTGPSMRWG